MTLPNMAAAEQAEQNRAMASFADIQEQADAEGCEAATVGPVTVVTELGVPSFAAPGVLRAAELRDRVRAAIVNSGLAWPLRRLTVGGTEVPDLAVALAVLAASGQITTGHAGAAWAAAAPSVSLDGSLRPCRFRDLVELLATTRPI